VPAIIPEATPLQESALLAQLRPALIKYFTRRIGNAAEAEDLAQDVLLRTYRAAPGDSPEDARRYVFRAAVNRWRDYLRRRQTHGQEIAPEDAPLEELGVDHPTDRVIEAREELDLTVQVLQRLPAKTRLIVTLIRFENMKIATVAEMVGLSINGVAKHMGRAMMEILAERNRRSRRP